MLVDLGRCQLRDAMPVKRVHELADTDRLGEITKKSCLDPFFDVARDRVGGQGQDRDMGGQRVVAQDLECAVTAHPGQIDVHQDHVGHIGAREFDAEVGVDGRDQLQVASACDQLFDQGEVGGIVFNI